MDSILEQLDFDKENIRKASSHFPGKFGLLACMAPDGWWDRGWDVVDVSGNPVTKEDYASWHNALFDMRDELYEKYHHELNNHG